VIVVSDTTPLNYLVLINAVDVLPKLFQEVYVTTAVLGELMHAKAPETVCRWAQSPPAWLRVEDPLSLLPSTARLGPGEAAAISLAKERHIATVLIDERRGTNVARREGLFPLPTLAIIELAAERDILPIRSAIEKLQATNIRISRELVAAALDRDAKRKIAGNRPT
jgi:predicted nucleic acid-binding protein